MNLSPSDRQLEMLRLYGQLICEHEDWGGKLVLAFGDHAYLVPVPVSIAGGTTLLIDDDAAAVKAAMRRGELDFVVNSLDEALRVLKNQIRQKKPLGVGLIAAVETTLAELTARGVQPDIAINSDSIAAVEDELFFAVPDAKELQRLEATLLEVMPAEDVIRRRWLRRLPQYLREAGSGGRWIWLSEEEREALAARGFSSESR